MKRTRQERQDARLDPDGWIRQLPPHIQKFWLEDDTNRQSLRKIRRGEWYHTGARAALWLSIFGFVTAAPLFVGFGGPFALTAMAIRFGIAVGTIIPAYTAAWLTEIRIKKRNFTHWTELCDRIGRQTHELSRVRHRLPHEQVSQIPQAGLRAYDEVVPRHFSLVTAAQGLGENRANRIGSLIAIGVVLPFIAPFTYLYVWLEGKRHREKIRQINEQQSVSTQALAAYMDSAQLRTSDDSGIDSARNARLEDASDAIQHELFIVAFKAMKADAERRGGLQLKLYNMTARVCVVLMAICSALGIPPSQALVAINAASLRAASASSDASHEGAINGYVEAANRMVDLPQTRREAQEEPNPLIDGVDIFRLETKHGPGQVSVQLRLGELSMFLGENGVGKTSFFNGLAGATSPEGGSVSFHMGRNVPASPEEIYCHISLATTDAGPNLEEMKRKWSNVTNEGLIGAMVRFGLEHEVARKFVEGEMKFKDLSGGQRARAVIAPRLVFAPQKVILVDEPLAMINDAARLAFVVEMKAVARERKIAIVMTNNDDKGLLEADRLFVFKRGGGCIVDGPPPDVLNPRLPPKYWKFVQHKYGLVEKLRQGLTDADRQKHEDDWYGRQGEYFWEPPDAIVLGSAEVAFLFSQRRERALPVHPTQRDLEAVAFPDVNLENQALDPLFALTPEVLGELANLLRPEVLKTRFGVHSRNWSSPSIAPPSEWTTPRIIAGSLAD